MTGSRSGSTAPDGLRLPAVRRAALVGGASLTAQCLDLALDAGLAVAVVATENAGVAARAADHGIPVVLPDALAAAVREHGADVLLSVAHLRLVPDEVLDAVEVALNFHDGPLPRYAGLDVPSWALWNGESEHAVTWHLMTTAADAGLVVHEERFEVGPRETSFSLNARCYEAALATFPTIAADLLAGTATAHPQSDGERHLHLRHDRPTSVLDPARVATDLVREVRALSLGSQAVNQMGHAHLVGPAGAVVVTDAEVRPSTGAPTGTLAAAGAGLRLTTVDGDALLQGIATPGGVALDPAEALAAVGVADGAVLTVPDGLGAAFAAADPDLARTEAVARDQLRGAVLAPPPPLDDTGNGPVTVRRARPSGVDEDRLLATVAAWAWRTGGSAPALAVTDADARARLDALAPLLRPAVVRTEIGDDTSTTTLLAAASAELAAARTRGPFLADVVGRDPSLLGSDAVPAVRVDLGRSPDAPAEPDGAALVVSVDDTAWGVTADVPGATLERVADQLEALLVGGLADADGPIARLPLLGETERDLLDAVNATAREHDRTLTLDAMVAAQVARTPEATAVTAGASSLTYAELWDRSGGLAGALSAAGVGVGDRVGIAVERSTDLVVAVLAVLRAGAAYVPLDPAYPTERLALMVEDSGLRTVIGGDTLTLPDGVTALAPSASGELPDPMHAPEDLAYTIYTSGSTGRPKGVLLEHRTVVNFFVAMDDVLAVEEPGTWLAVTSLSFDISVLELLWTLTRGFHVVVQPERGVAGGRNASAVDVAVEPASMSLFYFAAGEETAGDGYRLLLDSARWADRNGFEAVWTPERHFHAFGGAYPNPSVISAALAVATEHVQIRSGSVVAPLHNAARIAEEWAVVDNLSGGRVGISFAPGWQINDFVLNPSGWETARSGLADTIDTVQRLWRGETVAMPGADGDVDVRTLPRPVQPELPTWLTSAGTPSSFERAGSIGANLLTHLLGQSLETLTENIGRYRAAWDEAGHDGEGHVTLMLHTYLDEDAETSKRLAFEPMKDYLRTATGLLRNMASSFPTLSSGGRDADEAFRNLTDGEMEELLEVAAHRYLDGDSGLFGTVDDAILMVRRASAAGVDEVACLVDFGVETDAVLDSLPRLGRVREQLVADRAAALAALPDDALQLDTSFAGLVAKHGVTHVQCTPSLATMLVADPADREALARVDHLLLGGEALPTALASELRALLPGRFTNMYGPTETTIWSLVHEIDAIPDGTVPIGRPIANTTLAVLDPRGEPVPVGAWGELHLGGEGVARGYHARPELTAERFVDRPGLGRAYATGDVVRLRPDGVVEFAGRTDHQVKIRGHRIELGEIETVLDQHPDIVSSVVVAHARELGDPLLVAFLVTRGGSSVDDATVRETVAATLPDAYVPGRVVMLDGFPLTPNGKTDRSRLVADVDQHLAGTSAPVAAELDDDTERLVAEVWADELGAPAGPDDNFFEIGGNSLLAVAVFRRLVETTGADLALTDVFRHPTIRAFAAHLTRATGGDDDAAAQPAEQAPAGTDRGAMRRRARARR